MKWLCDFQVYNSFSISSIPIYCRALCVTSIMSVCSSLGLIKMFTRKHSASFPPLSFGDRCVLSGYLFGQGNDLTFHPLLQDSIWHSRFIRERCFCYITILHFFCLRIKTKKKRMFVHMTRSSIAMCRPCFDLDSNK